MKKQQLLDVVEATASTTDTGAKKYDDYILTSRREYHEPKEIMDIVREILSNYGKPTDELKDVDDMIDDINEQADRNTPIYDRHLVEWFAADNYQAYDEVAGEFGMESMGNSIIKGIQMAYCVTLENEVRETMQLIWDEAQAKIDNTDTTLKH